MDKGKKKKFEEVEFSVQDLLPIGITFIILAIGLAFGALILGDIKDDQVVDSMAYNITKQGEEAVGVFSGKMKIIALVIVAALLIGILMTYMGARARG